MICVRWCIGMPSSLRSRSVDTGRGIDLGERGRGSRAVTSAPPLWAYHTKNPRIALKSAVRDAAPISWRPRNRDTSTAWSCSTVLSA